MNRDVTTPPYFNINNVIRTGKAAAFIASAAFFLSSCGEDAPTANEKGPADNLEQFTDSISTPATKAPTPVPTAELPPAPTAIPAVEIPATTPEAVAPAPAPTPNSEEAAPVADPTIIAIDAGHGPTRTVIDAKTGLRQAESYNQPETDKVWNVAVRVKNSLQKDGYKVVMLKESKEENVTFRQRADRANQADADLAVSIHGDPTLPNTGWLFPQQVGLYRGEGASKTVFNNARISGLSQKYAEIIKAERQRVEGPDILVKTNNFDGRPGLDPGTIPMVQLFGNKTPWVYSEKQMPFINEVYSLSLVRGIKAALPSKK